MNEYKNSMPKTKKPTSKKKVGYVNLTRPTTRKEPYTEYIRHYAHKHKFAVDKAKKVVEDRGLWTKDEKLRATWTSRIEAWNDKQAWNDKPKPKPKPKTTRRDLEELVKWHFSHLPEKDPSVESVKSSFVVPTSRGCGHNGCHNGCARCDPDILRPLKGLK